MDSLPDELMTDVLDYLDPLDIVSLQQLSPHLLKVGRDSSLWRYKCFERAPSAAQSQANRPDAVSMMTAVLGGLSLDAPRSSTTHNVDQQSQSVSGVRASRRAKAVAEWDCALSTEKIDWYSEYVARHAPLSTEWATESFAPREIRGMALFAEGQKVISPLDDGSLCVWDITRSLNGRPKLRQTARSREGTIFQDLLSKPESSTKRARSIGTAIDNITVDSKRMRAYVAADDLLNEVDLETMKVIGQKREAWPITALSQERSDYEFSLTVGTSWSLHVHDPRTPLGGMMLRVSGDSTTRTSSVEESSIAFLPNYTKLRSLRSSMAIPDTPPSSQEAYYIDSSPSPDYLNGLTMPLLNDYARCEPGPQSILHHGDHEIIIAGRMPSILFYDRRTFPKLQSVIHSGARLSSMAILPVPPKQSTTSVGNATLIACGEYNGKGSLEIYELPHVRQSPISMQVQSPFTISSPSPSPSPSPTPADSPQSETQFGRPFKSQNRTTASSSKLLSVVTHGTRILTSDAEGTLKWTERDGRGLARRWNINSYNISSQGGSLSNELVVRKMLTLPAYHSRSSTLDKYDEMRAEQRGQSGDNDVLVFTGEKVGIVTTKSRWEECGHDELVRDFETKLTLNGGGHHVDNGDDDDNVGAVSEREREEDYARVMRMALERQADERRYMSRFGGRR